MDCQFFEANIRLIKTKRSYFAFKDEIIDGSKSSYVIHKQKLRRENRKLTDANQQLGEACDDLLNMCRRDLAQYVRIINKTDAEVRGAILDFAEDNEAKQRELRARIKVLEADLLGVRGEMDERYSRDEYCNAQ